MALEVTRRPGVIVTSKSGNVPCSTIDLRLYIGNDNRADILEAIDVAVADFKEKVAARLTEELKL